MRKRTRQIPRKASGSKPKAKPTAHKPVRMCDEMPKGPISRAFDNLMGRS